MRKYNGEKLKQKDVRPTNIADFERIAKHHNVNIMLHERKKEPWRMQDVYGS